MADAYGSRRHSAFTDADLSDRKAAPLLARSVLEEKLAAFPALRMTLQAQVGRYPGIHLVYAHPRRFYSHPVCQESRRCRVERAEQYANHKNPDRTAESRSMNDCRVFRPSLVLES